MTKITEKVKLLLDRGAAIPKPESVFIGSGVDMDRVSPDITIHPGCRITGTATYVGRGCEIGAESPATVDDCQLAENVSLKGGYFSGATFLTGASFGSGAHIRPATLLEEEASCAHSVGLKQTLLFPFVTLGSMINFCDCFMSGGTDRKNHSEVGSSYVHFNYTPHQDKATASLIGDVPRGVMLDQPPIFLGGQGGLVGPSTIEYGAITAAGTICRKNITETGKLYYDHTLPERFELPYQPGAYGDISRIITNNIKYIGNLIALICWYKDVRSLFVGKQYAQECHDGALDKIRGMLKERVKRMTQLAEHMPNSLKIAEKRLGAEPTEPPFDKQKRLCDEWPGLAEKLLSGNFNTQSKEKETLLSQVGSNKLTYIETIQSLDPGTRSAGTAWLQSIVDKVRDLWHHQ